MRNILVAYGGISPEHEVAIITALQVMNALKGAGFEVIPVYVSKEGIWRQGDDRFLKPEFYKDLVRAAEAGKRLMVVPDRSTRLLRESVFGLFGAYKEAEAVFPVFHGRNGEDGAIQGLLELSGLPYVGCGVTASGVGIDKFICKKVAAGLGIKVLRDVLVTKSSWDKVKEEVRKEAESWGWPVFVKPATLGSSIAISKVKKAEELEEAVEVAFVYDDRVVIEEGLDKPTEVNISIIGNGPYEVSATEQPVGRDEMLSYEDKYLRGGGKGGKRAGMAAAQRLIPAPVDKKIIREVEEAAKGIFEAIGGRGIARVDFMVDKNRVYFNEINTMPGSLSFYLWEKSGVEFKDLVIRLVDLAMEAEEEKKKKITTFDSNILAGFAAGGLKGGRTGS